MDKNRTCATIALLAVILIVPCAASAGHEVANQVYQTALETYKQTGAENDRLREQQRVACRASAVNQDACATAEAASEASFERAKEAYAAYLDAESRYKEAERRHQ